MQDCVSYMFFPNASSWFVACVVFLRVLAVWINRTPSYTGCKFPGIVGRSEDNATRTASTSCDHKVQGNDPLAARDISGSCQPDCLQEIVIASADDCEDASYYQFYQPRCQKSQKRRKSQDLLLPARNSKMHWATPLYNARKHHSAQPSNSPNSIVLCTVDNGTAVGLRHWCIAYSSTHNKEPSPTHQPELRALHQCVRCP